MQQLFALCNKKRDYFGNNTLVFIIFYCFCGNLGKKRLA